ncbi:MAG: hypothetical protein ACKOXT_03865 [Actinomycetota bacterium]
MEEQTLTPLAWLIDAGISMIPPILVGLLFYVVMRSIIRADATERKVYKQIEAEERAKREKRPNA